MDPELYSVAFCLEDWDRVIQSLRNEAYLLNQDSKRALKHDSPEYATLLWEECAILNDLADTIAFKLPE